MFVATINTPGYLPMDDDPPVFETAAEAWEYLAEERKRAEDDAPEWADHSCDFPSDCEYSETYVTLTRRASPDWLVADFERVGTLYGDTPGYDGDHDLGLAYTVTEVPAHTHYFRPDIKDWWCEECDTVTDYCQQINPT